MAQRFASNRQSCSANGTNLCYTNIVKRIDHVGLDVSDLDEVTRVLNTMGIGVARSVERPDRDLRGAFFQLADGSMIECMERGGGNAQPEAAILTHFAIEVADLDSVVERLQQ